jgi:hypothetical protein
MNSPSLFRSPFLAFLHVLLADFLFNQKGRSQKPFSGWLISAAFSNLWEIKRFLIVLA